MSPIGVGISNSTEILKTGEAKLWILLVGVNQYQDRGLPSLRYPALDCQGLGEALECATENFPNKEVIIHHDFTGHPPTLDTVRASVERIVSQSQPYDSILLYFSGHGMLEPNSQQAVLCLADTQQEDLLNTGLGMQDLLHMLGTSLAHQQLVCLDTCHSGNMMLMGSRSGNSNTLLNPTPQLTQLLRQRAAQSKGFCALLSCDQGQQSWEFPELGHGVFTYYLMQGILGEAADYQGVIEADGLYKYVYRKTLQYIEKLNQQVRLVNEQKLKRGDCQLIPEYPSQTPKRIVEGVGELILGFKPHQKLSRQGRRALVIDGLGTSQAVKDLSRLLRGAGRYEVNYFTDLQDNSVELREKIQEFIRWQGESNTKLAPLIAGVKNTSTALLYLRGRVEEIEDGEAWLILGNGVRLSRSWLRQELRRKGASQLIVILDFPIVETVHARSIKNWIEDLQQNSDQGQCIIAAASGIKEPQLFCETALQTLAQTDPKIDLPIAKWISQLRKHLQGQEIEFETWLSGTQGVIDILPGNVSTVFQDLELKPQAIATTAPTRETRVQVQPQTILAIGSQQYALLEMLLRQFIGPIAPNLLENVVLSATNFEELISGLTNHLLPKQKLEFKQRAIAILQTSPVSENSKPKEALNQKEELVNNEFVNRCERELAYLVGPFASFMIQEVLKSQQQISLTEFVKKLAAVIPEPKLAEQFEKRVLGK